MAAAPGSTGQWSVLSDFLATLISIQKFRLCFVASMSMPTITHDDNKTYTLPTIFHNIEQESGSKSRVRALTRDPTRPGPKLLTRWPADPWPGDPVPSLVYGLGPFEIFLLPATKNVGRHVFFVLAMCRRKKLSAGMSGRLIGQICRQQNGRCEHALKSYTLGFLFTKVTFQSVNVHTFTFTSNFR